MIRRLRWKFTLINLLFVGLVLVVVFAVLVASNARRLADQSDTAMRLALSWQDDEAPPRFEVGAPPRSSDEQESPHFTMIPVFVVTVEGGEVTALNDGGHVEVSEETAAQAAQEALSSGLEKGTLPGFHLCFTIEHMPDGSLRIAFADRSWESASLRVLVLNCLLIWLLAMAVFFLISLFLASRAVRPVEQAWQSQRQFVADASHELKTPLTVILANTDIVLAHPEAQVAEQAKWLEYTRDEAGQMKGLVEDLLFLAKADAARQGSTPTLVFLSELALGCLLPFESVAFEAGVTLEHQIAPDLTLMGDEGQLRRLIRILLDNAVKYAGPGGTATLTLERRQDKLRLTVCNTGQPIPPEHLPHLFERFYRADTARDRQAGGYGLGLSIAKSIVEGHRGKISVTSAPGAGTTFTVTLPFRAPARNS